MVQLTWRNTSLISSAFLRQRLSYKSWNGLHLPQRSLTQKSSKIFEKYHALVNAVSFMGDLWRTRLLRISTITWILASMVVTKDWIGLDGGLLPTGPNLCHQDIYWVGCKAIFNTLSYELPDGRQRKVRSNRDEFDLLSLIGVGLQGTLIGQLEYLVLSDDNTDIDDQYKHVDWVQFYRTCSI